MVTMTVAFWFHRWIVPDLDGEWILLGHRSFSTASFITGARVLGLVSDDFLPLDAWGRDTGWTLADLDGELKVDDRLRYRTWSGPMEERDVRVEKVFIRSRRGRRKERWLVWVGGTLAFDDLGSFEEAVEARRRLEAVDGGWWARRVAREVVR